MWPFSKKKFNVNKTNTSSAQNTPLTFATVGSFAPNYVSLTGNNKIQNDLLICEYFNTLSEVSAPIRKYSDQTKNIILTYQNKKLDSIDSKERPLIKVINEFWLNSSELFVIYDLLLGNSYIQGFESGTFETKGVKTLTDLFLLPSEFTNVNLSSVQQDIRNPSIKDYTVQLNGNYKDLTLKTEEVLHIKTPSTYSYTQNELYGLSRLVSCEKNIQSIASGYGAKIALYDNGPRVIVTGERQGEFAQTNINEDIKDVQKRANDIYGRTEGQFQMLFTDVPLKASVISLNVRELMLNENNGSDFRRVCNAYNQDSKIHGDPDSTTYDNVTTALSDFYNGSLKSYINSRVKKLNQFISKWDDDLIINADYSNIKEIAEFERKNEAMEFEKAAKGLITRNKYLEQINQDTVNLPEFDQYYVYANDGLWYPINAQQTNNE